jgi:hypothetical protein
MSSGNLELVYNSLPTVIKDHAGLPDLYHDLSTEQERFIVEMYTRDHGPTKKELLDTVEELKGLIDEL